MTGRPLLITDCDEVLLHMVAHFQDWLGEAHDIRFAFETGQFREALTHRTTGQLVAEDRVWPRGFHRTVDRDPQCRVGDVSNRVFSHCREPLCRTRLSNITSFGTPVTSR